MKIVLFVFVVDFFDLMFVVEICEQGQVDFVYFDVMDGYFVLNFMFGFFVIDVLVEKMDVLFDIYLMVEWFGDLMDYYLVCKLYWVLFYWEVGGYVDCFVYQIKEVGVGVGIVFNLVILIDVFIDVFEEFDFVFFMFVNLGFVGQLFVGYVFDKC